MFSLLQASPDNSRNPSPRYHDVSMEDVSTEVLILDVGFSCFIWYFFTTVF